MGLLTAAAPGSAGLCANSVLVLPDLAARDPDPVIGSRWQQHWAAAAAA